MQFKNLNELSPFSQLKNLKPANLHTLLDAKRIERASLPCGGGLTYNWAAMPIEESHLRAFQALADEQQLIEKYIALLGGSDEYRGGAPCPPPPHSREGPRRRHFGLYR